MNNYHATALRDHFRTYWRPEPDCPVWLWAQNNIYLSSMESSDKAGMFTADITPFIKEPLECFRDDAINEISLVFGTQICKTLMVMIGAAWMLTHREGRGGWVMDTENNARSFSETRWQPLVRSCDALAAQIPAGRENFKNLQQRIGGSILHFMGSNSPGNLAQRPLDWFIGDEVDKWAIATAREADALTNVLQRLKSRSNTKAVYVSSPSTEYGLIWERYLEGDQRQYLVACPHCRNFDLLTFEQVKWDPAAKEFGKWNYTQVINSTRYICRHCGAAVHDGHKTAMLRGGNWEPTNASAAPGTRSYQLSSLYSPWEKTNFGNLAVEFLKHKSRFDMKGWDNGYMARPSKDQAIELDWEMLAKRRDPSPEIPEWVAFITGFQDTQDSWLEHGLIGWGENLEHAVIEHERIIVDPADPDNWETTRQHIERERATASGRAVPLLWYFCDFGGHHQTAVTNFVKSMRGYPVHLSFGSKLPNLPAKGRITKTKSKPRHRLFEIGVSEAKRKVFSFLTRTKPGRGYCHFMAAALDADSGKRPLDDAYFLGLCAERLEPRTVGRTTENVWVQVRDRNEPLDIHVGCYCGLLQIPQARRLAAIKAMLAANGKRRGAKDEVVDEHVSDAEVDKSEVIVPKRGRPRRTTGRGNGRRGGGRNFATDI